MTTVQFSRFDEQTEQRMMNVYETLSEKHRRRYTAIQASQLGHGGRAYVAAVLACSTRTISPCIEELDRLPQEVTPGRIRRPGAGWSKKSRRGGIWKRI